MAGPTYTVFIRVPIPRGDFVDPPAVSWDAAKDEELWNILSGAAQTELDWNDLALRFDATVDFLVQQVAYLTERHAAKVREQLRRATAAKSANVSTPSPGNESAGHTRTTSALSFRRDSPMLRPDTSGPAIPGSVPMRPNMSRTGSGNAVATTYNSSSGAGGSLRAGVGRNAVRPNLGEIHASSASSTTTRQQQHHTHHHHHHNHNQHHHHQAPNQPHQQHRLSEVSVQSPDDGTEISSAESLSSDSDSDDSGHVGQSRIIRRPPRFSAPSRDGTRGGAPSPFADDEDEDTEPAFQVQNQTGTSSRTSRGTHSNTSAHDLTATLRGDGHDMLGKRLQKLPMRDRELDRINQSQTSDSSSSSAAMVSRNVSGGERKRGTTTSTTTTTTTNAQTSMLPRTRSDIVGSSKSPGGKGSRAMSSREGSDGTPSMGSSFSDLEDASVTRSELEEALLSKMQDGSLSRFSIGGVFTSRYAGSK